MRLARYTFNGLSSVNKQLEHTVNKTSEFKLVPLNSTIIRRNQLHRLTRVVESYLDKPRHIRTPWGGSAKEQVYWLDLIERAVAGSEWNDRIVRRAIEDGEMHPLWVRWYRLLMDLSL